MDRRDFIKTLTASTAALHTLAVHAGSPYVLPSPAGLCPPRRRLSMAIRSSSASSATQRHGLSTRTSAHAMAYSPSSARMAMARVLRKTAEPTFADNGPQYLGLDLKDIGMADADLLADKLLAHGDPSEDEVRRAAPPMNSDHSERAQPQFSPWVEYVRRHTRVQ